MDVANFSALKAAADAFRATGDAAARLPRLALDAGELRLDSTRITADAAHLLHWCRATERIVLDPAVESPRVYAGFERLSRMRGVLPRYERLVRRGAEVWLFGEGDWKPPLAVDGIVEVREGPLLREWFLLVLSKRYCGLLAAAERDGSDSSRRLQERRFEGLVSHRRPVVERTAAALDAVVESVLHAS